MILKVTASLLLALVVSASALPPRLADHLATSMATELRAVNLRHVSVSIRAVRMFTR